MTKLGKALVIILTFLLLFLIIILNCTTTVPTGYVGIKTRFGKVQDDVIQEGLNMKAPFIEKIVKINCKTRILEISSNSSTKDMQDVEAKIAINFNVNKQKANILYRDIGNDFVNIIIAPSSIEAVKSTLAQYTAEELVTKRSEVSNQIQQVIIEKIEDKGFDITEFNLINIDFSEEYDKAIEAKAVKQQEVETAKAELERQKIQNEKEIAEAEKDARVMELQNAQITENTLRLKMLEKWDGKLPNTMLNDDINSIFNVGGNQ